DDEGFLLGGGDKRGSSQKKGGWKESAMHSMLPKKWLCSFNTEGTEGHREEKVAGLGLGLRLQFALRSFGPGEAPWFQDDNAFFFSGSLGGFFGAGAEMVPDGDEDDGNDEDQRRDGVDFGSNTAAEAAPNFLRERVVAADEKKCDSNFV